MLARKGACEAHLLAFLLAAGVGVLLTVLRHGGRLLALLGLTSLVLYAVVSLTYDRDVAGEDARAAACHDRTFARLVERGYPPFRTGVQSQGLAPAGDPTYQRIVDALATTLDPAGVLAPGRYPFSPR